MTENTRRIHDTHLNVAAVIAGSGVFVVVFLQNLFVSVVTTFAYEPFFGSTRGFVQVSAQYFWVALPFGIGVCVSLWWIAPLAARLQLPAIVLRGVLAAGVGAVFTLAVTALLGALGSVGFSGALFANSFPQARFDAGNAVSGVLAGLTSGGQVFIGNLPLVVLACVVLWMWLKSPGQVMRSSL